jgi:hypothetical protein
MLGEWNRHPEESCGVEMSPGIQSANGAYVVVRLLHGVE